MTPAGYRLDLEDLVGGDELDRDLWLPYSLPHRSSRTASAARYRLGDGVLRLVVEEDQPPRSPEFDGGVRVSSLQTGEFCAPVASPASSRCAPAWTSTEQHGRALDDRLRGRPRALR